MIHSETDFWVVIALMMAHLQPFALLLIPLMVPWVVGVDFADLIQVLDDQIVVYDQKSSVSIDFSFCLPLPSPPSSALM